MARVFPDFLMLIFSFILFISSVIRLFFRDLCLICPTYLDLVEHGLLSRKAAGNQGYNFTNVITNSPSQDQIHSPRWSYFTDLPYDFWVQTIYSVTPVIVIVAVRLLISELISELHCNPNSLSQMFPAVTYVITMCSLHVPLGHINFLVRLRLCLVMWCTLLSFYGCLIHVYNIHVSASSCGEQGWRSGESTCLSPMWPRFNSWARHHIVFTRV